APVDDWPVAEGGSARSAQDSPRGHEDVESTGRFPASRPALPSAGPGDTAEFPAIGSAPEPRGAAGGFDRPQRGDAPNSTSGQFARPVQGDAPSSTSGQYERPALGEAPGSTSGQFARPVQGDTPSSTSGQYERPALGEAPGSTSGQFARPELDDDPLTSTTGQFAQPALRESGHSSPLFEELESNWFRGAAGEGQAGAPEQTPDAPSGQNLPKRQPRQSLQDPERGPLGAVPRAPQAGRPTRPSQARPVPQTRQAPAAQQPQQAPADNWRQSPNDETWRRAEQVREPSAGGKTSSGLPRRVPKANLVEGAAQTTQPIQQVGPQVSRAPDDVRGRLTNLRRGIQQGRQAGNTTTGNHTVDPTNYQQER
ncbi:histidine kinase, partial [Streptomyces sp. KLMMK]